MEELFIPRRLYVYVMSEATQQTDDEAETEEQNDAPDGIQDRPGLIEELYHEHRLSQTEVGALDELASSQELDELDAEELAGLVEAAEDPGDVGLSASAMSHHFDRHDIETRASGPADERLGDEEWLWEQFVEEGEGMVAIGEECGVSDGTAMRYLHKAAEESDLTWDEWKEEKRDRHTASDGEEEADE